MGAFGKTLTACTLAFGSLGSGLSGSWGWNNPHQSTYKQDDGKAKHASYDNNDWKSGKNFYNLKWDDQRKLCSDDHYWMMWAQKSGASYWDRGNYCQNNKNRQDYGKQADWNKNDHKYQKDDNRNYGMKDWNDSDWGKKNHKDYGYGNQYSNFNKKEEFKQSYSKHEEKHEKQVYALVADYKHQSKKDNEDCFVPYKPSYQKKDDYAYGRNDYDNYGKNDGYNQDHKQYGFKGDNNYGEDHEDYGNRKDNYQQDDTKVKAYVATQKDVEASNKAQTNQAVVVNNYNYINGNNNVINNNISVSNNAQTEQKASASQSTQAAFSYNNNQQDYNKGSNDWGKGSYGQNSYKNDQASIKLAASEEKDYSSDVKQSQDYKLNQSYSQSNQKQHDNYGQEDYNKGGYGHENEDHQDFNKKPQHAYAQQHQNDYCDQQQDECDQ